MQPVYLNISKPARVRLADLRARASASQSNPNESTRCSTWQQWRARHSNLTNWQAQHATLASGRQGKTPIWYTHAGAEFRGERFADECEGGPDHTGWFTQADGTTYKDGTGLARGIVARLSHGRFIAGYWWGDNGERVYFPGVFDSERDAARMADEHARVFADEAREDNAKWEAARRLEDDTETAVQRLRECLALRHRQCMDYVRDEARALIEAIRDSRGRLSSEFAEYR